MLTRFQVMAIAQAIGREENRQFGDAILISRLTEVIQQAEKEMAYYHDSPVDALKQAESYLTDATNMLDQANDRTKLTTDLGKRVDAVLGDVQELIGYMEREPEPQDV